MMLICNHMSRKRNTTVKKHSKIIDSERFISFYNNHDWEFMLDLEQFKLKRMSKYFSKSNLSYDCEKTVKEINLCIKLIDIILEKDLPGFLYNNTKKLPYINTRNYKRFLKYIYDNDNYRDDLRQTKALYLYNLIRTYRMRSWWD